MQQIRIKLIKGVPVVTYSESFKKEVVREYERGHSVRNRFRLSMESEARADCWIGVVSMVDLINQVPLQMVDR